MTIWERECAMNPTNDPSLRSWVPVPPDSDFPIQNLPFGVFSLGWRSITVVYELFKMLNSGHEISLALLHRYDT